MKILVVDDSQTQRRIIKNCVRGVPGYAGAELIEALDGELAWRAISEHVIDLILLDYNMPNLTGPQFIERIKNHPKYKDIPIIMITAEAAKYNVLEIMRKGVTAYIIKPMSVEKLIPKIIDVMDKKGVTL